MLNSILNSSLQGVLRGMERMDKAVNEIARAGTDGNIDIADHSRDLVDLKIQEQGIKANLSVIKVADDILGTLLDERV